MKALPHHYSVNVAGSPGGNLTVSANNLPTLDVAPPEQFDGPGDQWSPEELLMAAVANCLVLSFRAIAKASKLEWISIHCESQGELDRVERKTQFTTIKTTVRLAIAAEGDKAKAEKLLNKAEQTCFISNSLSVDSQLECDVVIDG